jgi:ABC-type phosphate transport system substrate-binding protein
LRVAATDLAGPLLADLAQAYSAARPQTSLLAATTPLSALSGDLAAGRADLALTATYSTDHFATPVGYVTLLVVVNPANPLGQLSAAQLRDIFSGRANDWSEVGSLAGPIQVVCREDHSDGAEAFDRLALEGSLPTLNALVAPDWAAMRTAVSRNPKAIGYLPAPEVGAGVRPIKVEKPLRVLIAAVAPQTPTGASRDFLAWVQSAAGQEVVRQRYETVNP